MEPEIAIRLEDVFVDYEVFADKHLTLRRLAAQRFKGRDSRLVHALKGISNIIYEGEVLGVVGSNGSGKSTLLSVIAGLLPPSNGSVLVKSQPALLGVNAALKPELSGDRNIEIGALAMGLKMSEINSYKTQIQEYTELGEALDRPMRTYSSGMRSRLAFSIATIKTPEILLIDEALAVGDAEFRKKSLNRIREMQNDAKTIIMVTHNLSEIRKTCSRAIWIEKGLLKMDGEVKEVLDLYEQQSTSSN